jgi:hypothetical protein
LDFAVPRDDQPPVMQVQFARREPVERRERQVEFFRQPDEIAPFQKPLRLVEIFTAGHQFHLPVAEVVPLLQAFFKGDAVFSARDVHLVVRDDARDRLAQKRGVKRIGHGQLQRVNQIMAGDGAQPGKYFFGELQIRLVERQFAGLVGMKAGSAEIVFQNRAESGSAGLVDVKKYNHGKIIPAQGITLQIIQT